MKNSVDQTIGKALELKSNRGHGGKLGSQRVTGKRKTTQPKKNNGFLSNDLPAPSAPPVFTPKTAKPGRFAPMSAVCDSIDHFGSCPSDLELWGFSVLRSCLSALTYRVRPFVYSRH